MKQTYIIPKQTQGNQWERKLQTILFLVIFVLLIARGLVWLSNNPIIQSSSATTLSTTVLPSIVVTPTPLPPTITLSPSLVDPSKIKSVIQTAVAAHPALNIGVSYINIKDGTRVDENGNQIFTAASTTKVFIACLLLSQVESGKYTLIQPLDGATVGEHLQLMINQSNNDSWADLMNFIGYQYQAPYAKQLGITTYNLATNQMSPNDMALLLDKLYAGHILNPQDTSLLLSYMQHTNMESLIPPAVPQGVTVYHKYGNYNTDLHDAAIIDDGKNPFVLVIYTSLINPVTYTERLLAFHDIVIAVENAQGINTTSIQITPPQTAAQPSMTE